ncbi:MAG: acetyl-CoA carboxylase, carboxyltransferase subunit beta [Verrucomicrobiota bacterium]
MIKRKGIPEGLWTKCENCSEMLYTQKLEENQSVCPKCDFHHSISAHDRLHFLLDPDSFQEMDENMETKDVLQFTGTASYTDRLKHYQNKSGIKEALVSGLGKIESIPVSIAVMEFAFLGGSMGSVVGEKITRAIELATQKKLPVIIISASGGARMYEGMLSLMQMAKTSGALSRHAEKKLPFISVLTHPTMGGVTASFASLGDLIIAEPKAMVGFAGARVIKETTLQDLPPGFQTAEFLSDHGLVDLIVSRLQMRSVLANLLTYLGHSPTA